MTSAADGSREPFLDQKPPRWPTVRVVFTPGGSYAGRWSVQRRYWWWPFWQEVDWLGATDEGKVIAIERAKMLKNPPVYLA